MTNVATIDHTLTGVAEVAAILNTLADRHVVRITRNTNYQIAKYAQRQIFLEVKSVLKQRTGSLRRSIRFRATEKGSTSFEVYFTPRAFYWRFVEHGHDRAQPKKFLDAAIRNVNRMLPELIKFNFTKFLEKQLANELAYQAVRAREAARQVR